MEDWWTLDIEAADMDEAMDKFHRGGYNHEDAVLTAGGFLQDSVEIEEIA